MAKTIKPSALDEELQKQLSLYHEDVIKGVNEAGDEAMKKLVKLSKAAAPVDTGDFKKAITSKTVDGGNGMKSFIWYVKAPLHRLTHLLVHGHAKKGGGRVPGDPFLQNALDQVLPEYEQKVKEAVK